MDFLPEIIPESRSASGVPAFVSPFQPSQRGEEQRKTKDVCQLPPRKALRSLPFKPLCPQFSHMVSQLSFQRDWANQTSFGMAKIMAKIREFVLPGKEKNRDGEATINHWLTHVSTLSILASASPGLQPLFPVKSPMSYRMETSQSCVVYKELFFFFDI